ncbi:rna pseudouridine synthase superfamily protein [Cystoisospora suis]|uniref:Rna pseudouridine synthase superfamily protein n=1 Tax=Cystoisospora suis TaxID=483139 RepID=A0A2C6L2I6_9APIC|nr:rna pseudouridine synthase superfamily protein [Cystoisospora suis]
MLAHNKETAREVQDLLQAHRIYKEYAALVYGHPKWNVVEVETGIAPHPSHPFKMIATDRKGFPLSPLSLSENSSLFFNPSSHCVAHGGESSAGVEKQKKKVEIKMREEYKGAKKAVSRLQVLMRGYFNLRGPLHGEPATLLKLSPITGRRHQLRVHCHYVGHSIVGDSTYGGPHDSFPFRMFLHASTLYFPSVSSSLKSSSSRNSLDLGEKERGKREGEAHKKSVEDAKEETHVKSCEGGELENRRKKFSLRTGGSCTSSCLLKEREVLGPLKAEKIEEDKQNPPSLGEDKQKKKKKRHLQNVSYLSEVPQKVTAPHDFALFLDPELNPPSLSPS